MNIIPSMFSEKNVLIFNNQAGGGHRSAVETITQQIKNCNGVPIVKDVFSDVLGKRISGNLYNFWNNAMKSENLEKLNLPLKMQSIGEFFLAIPEFIKVTNWLLKNKIDAIVNPQPAGLHAITKSVRVANFINKYILRNDKRIFIYNVLTELPTKHTTDFFATYKNLSKEDRKICKLISTKPLITESISEEEFWKRHTGFNMNQIIYDEFPVREPFIEYAKIDPKKIKELHFQVKNDQAREILEEISALPNGEMTKGTNGVRIRNQDSLTSIMLGSQAGGESTLKYVKDIISYHQGIKSDNQHFVFIFCGDYSANGVEESLFSKVADLVKTAQNQSTYPENLHIIPLENQKAEEIAPIFRRSNYTITRSGGMTAMELCKVASGKIYIHSSHLDPMQGMPEWEAGNIQYMKKKKGAKVITPANHPFLIENNNKFFEIDSKDTSPLRGFGIESFPNRGPALGSKSYADIRIISSVTHSFEWKKKLIETAEKSIELSANYAGGEGFREILQVIEKRMNQKPELKVHLICAKELLEAEDREYLKLLSKSPNFQYLITPGEISINGLKLQENHVKLLVVDEKYFVMGGSSITQAQNREEIPVNYTPTSLANKFIPSAFQDEDIVGSGQVASRMRGEFFKLYNILENKINGVSKALYSPVKGIKGENKEFEQSEGLFKKVKVKFFVCGPEHKDNNPITNVYVKLIDSAKKSIRIASSQFNPDTKILEALKKKKNKVSLRGQFNGVVQKFFIVYPSRVNYDYLDTIFEFNKKNVMYHKKIMVIDNKKFLIGSYNQSQKSSHFDYEIALEIDDKRCAKQIEIDMDEDLFQGKNYAKDNLHYPMDKAIGKGLRFFVRNLT